MIGFDFVCGDISEAFCKIFYSGKNNNGIFKIGNGLYVGVMSQTCEKFGLIFCI